MSFTNTRQPHAYINDTIRLTALISESMDVNDPVDNRTPVSATDISGVEFIIQRPQDPQGLFVTLAADTLENGKAQVTVAAAQHDQPGQYTAVAQFTWGPSATHDDFTTSVPCSYNINDPFEGSGVQPYDPAVDMAWSYFSDAFDSQDEEGGPWLKEITAGRFDKSRIRTFAPRVIFDINVTQPQTAYALNNFPYAANDGMALFTQGLVVHSIRHLIRSYVEQPDLVNSPVGYANRQRYVDVWSGVYKLELDGYTKMLDYYKRHLLDVGVKVLLSSKTGRGIFPGLRTRGVWRGYN